MPLKTKEGLIREKSVIELNQVITSNLKNYNNEEKLFAKEELFRRQLKNQNPIEQTDSILLLPDDVLKYIVEHLKSNYNTALFSVANTECKKRGFELEEWYYLLEGKKTGPISKTELEQLIDRKYLNEKVHIFKKGMEDWITIDDAIAKQLISVNYNAALPNTAAKNMDGNNDNLSDVGAVLSFLFPIIGLIIYLNNENNLKGKKAGNIALVSFILGVFLYVLLFTSFFK